MLSEKKEPVKYIKGLSIQVINLMRQGKEKSAKKLYKKVKNLFEKKKRKRKDHPVYLEAEYLAVNDWGRRFSISEYLILCSKYNSLYLNYKGIAAYHINMQEVSKSLFERSHKLNTKYKPAAINYNLANQGKPPVFIIKTPSVNKWEPEPVGFLYPVYAIMFTQIGMKKPNNEAKLYVSVKPVDAKIEISGISEPFYQGMELAPGTYNIKVSKDSYVAKNREIVLSSGERKNLKIKIRLKELANSIGMKFVWIPEGCFQMGSDDGDSDEKPVHEVCVDGYYMAKYEVTQGQWQAVMGTCPWSGKEYVRDTDNNPAVYVSWNNAQKFIKKVNNEKVDGRYRLPTEAEWEYACRAGSKTRFYFGGSDKKLGDYAWYGKNTWDTGEKYAHKVGSKKPNAWGLYDMHGNVWEWCEDLYDKNGYSRHSCKNPLLNYWGFARVLRGGSWYGSPWNVRSAGRIRRDPSHRYHYSGFRLVLLPGSSKPRQMYSEKAEKDGFCIEKDGFCIEKDGFCINKK